MASQGWTPVHNGIYFCSPACGGGKFCTKAQHAAALLLAKATAAELGEGWVPEVWENLGWHARAISPCGRWSVHPDPKGESVTAFLGPPGSLGGRWAASGRTARAAMARVRQEAQSALRELREIVEGA